MLEDLISHGYWATEGDTRERRQSVEAVVAYITGLLELQREACALTVGDNLHCASCDGAFCPDAPDRTDSDLDWPPGWNAATQVQKTPLVEIK